MNGESDEGSCTLSLVEKAHTLSDYLSFGICERETTKSAAQDLVPLVMQFSFNQKIILFGVKGYRRKFLPFAELFGAEKDENSMLSFSLCTKTLRLDFQSHTPFERDNICNAIRNIVINNDWRLPKYEHVTYEGFVEKRGKLQWAKRWLVLCKSKVLCYRFRNDTFPINVVYLPGMKVTPVEKNVFRLSITMREFSFRIPDNEERDIWLNKLSLICNDPAITPELIFQYDIESLPMISNNLPLVSWRSTASFGMERQKSMASKLTKYFKKKNKQPPTRKVFVENSNDPVGIVFVKDDMLLLEVRKSINLIDGVPKKFFFLLQGIQVCTRQELTMKADDFSTFVLRPCN